ncbi:AAA family ATPase [Paenibacillus sp. NPDC057967]|uniref:AAA family ATPase n=1 Tax=Paenibacillus sp. NPDC057967 TaxID=3346293 RepID=UPI0036DAA78E
MRLQEAFIDGYGRFHNRRLDLDAPVIVVYGPNEAGKSTLFGFLRTMLYGFARRSYPALRAEPLYGGRHGGRLLFRDGMGKSYYVLRHADEAGGKPRLREVSDSWGTAYEPASLEERMMEQREWEGQYLGGIQERLFRGLFAVTLTELQEVGILSGAELGRHLYEAGWESGGAVAAAEKEITQELEQLFKPKGTNQRMNAGLRKLEQLEAEWRRLEDGIESYNQCKQHEAAAVQKLEAIADRLPKVQLQLRYTQKALASRPAWLRMCQAVGEAEKYRYTESLPLGAEQAWHEWLSKRQEAEQKRDALKQEAGRLERQLADLSYDDGLIARTVDTEAALQSAERMHALKEQVSEWDNELGMLDETIGGLVMSISPEWTERQLRELNVTIADRDFARTMQERAHSLLRQEERLASELDALRLQRKEMVTQQDEAKTRMQQAKGALHPSEKGRFALNSTSKNGLMAAWNELDDALREWEFQLGPDTGDQSGTYGAHKASSVKGVAGAVIAAISAVVLGGASALGWLGEATLLGGVAAVGAGGIFVGLMISLRSRSSAADSKSRSASGRGRRRPFGQGEQRVREAFAGMTKEANSRTEAFLEQFRQSLLSHSGSMFRAMIRQDVQDRIEALGEYEIWRMKHDEAESRLARHRESASERAAAAGELKRRSEDFSAQWREWLAVRSLPGTLSPSAALEVFELAESAIEQLKRYDRMTIRREESCKELSRYEQKAVHLCEGVESADRLLRQDPALGLQALLTECRRHADIRREAGVLEARVRELNLELADEESKLDAIGQAISAAIGEAGLALEAEYAAVLEHFRLWTGLADEGRRLQLELTAGLAGEEWEEVERLLTHADEERLLSRLEGLRQEEAGLTQDHQELLERKGALGAAMEQLLQEGERQRLVAEREMILAGLDADMERYAVLSVSKSLIERTKRIYEQEKQPIVLRHASSYMNKLTEGRYVRVSADPSRSGIRVEDRENTVLDSGFLSRGTAEQLYLSMRLALAKESSQAAKLPLMLDDLFVNFDGNRLKAAAALVAELSEERQIVFFTCQEHTRDALLAACPGAKLVGLDTAAAVSG